MFKVEEFCRSFDDGLTEKSANIPGLSVSVKNATDLFGELNGLNCDSPRFPKINVVGVLFVLLKVSLIEGDLGNL
ncbi:MAG: hypothetical protein IPH82_15110 [Chloroflexi bacterium]|nr:hypothetical protein [Chloroflexota bacterium]